MKTLHRAAASGWEPPFANWTCRFPTASPFLQELCSSSKTWSREDLHFCISILLLRTLSTKVKWDLQGHGNDRMGSVLMSASTSQHSVAFKLLTECSKEKKKKLWASLRSSAGAVSKGQIHMWYTFVISKWFQAKHLLHSSLGWFSCAVTESLRCFINTGVYPQFRNPGVSKASADRGDTARSGDSFWKDSWKTGRIS